MREPESKKGRRRIRSPRRTVRARHPRLIGSFIIALFLVILLLIGGWWTYPYLWRYMSRQDAFKISEIIIRNAGGLDEAVLRVLLPPVEGQNLFAVDLRKVEEALRQHPWVENVKLHRHLPRKLVISVTEKTPAALICTERIWAVDRAGTLLPLENWSGTLDLPLVKFAGQKGHKAGQVISDGRVLGLLPRLQGLKRRLPQLWQMISEIAWDEKGQLILYASGSRTRILLGTQPCWQQMCNLYSFLLFEGSRSGLENIRFVDLRFRGQVIIRRAKAST